jgi:hypothetical protein
MSAFLIIITGLIYFYVGLEQWFKYNNLPMLLTYIGYAFANIGLYMMASK